MIIAETFVIFVSTLVSVAVMYLHSFGEHSGRRPPEFLLRITFMRGCGRNRVFSHQIDEDDEKVGKTNSTVSSS